MLGGPSISLSVKTRTHEDRKMKERYVFNDGRKFLLLGAEERVERWRRIRYFFLKKDKLEFVRRKCNFLKNISLKLSTRRTTGKDG